VCVDANAGARHAARQRWMEKDAKYRSESLKFWNRETSAVRGMQRAATGYSRAISNDYQRALYVQGQARKAYQAGFIKYQQTKGSVDEGGRDRRAKRKGLVALTRARGQLDNAVQKEFGVQMQRRYRARLLKMQSVQAQTRQSLGIRPEYGAPVLMPPSDRLSGALSIASTIVGIASGLQGMGLFSKSAGTGMAGAGAGLSTSQLFGGELLQSPLVNQPLGIGGYFTDTNPFIS
tara:strand:- start:7073 stop:7774 length:702 start_codon:yes stop_codon:yes gene_type:complete